MSNKKISKRKLQIGVMGSAADLKYSRKIEKIAEEKAGIIKDGVPVITSAQELSVMNVIERRAGEKNADLFIYGRDFSVAIKSEDTSGSVFNYNGDSCFEDLVIALPGRHQVLNASLALKTIEIVSKKSSHHASCITHHGYNLCSAWRRDSQKNHECKIQN